MEDRAQADAIKELPAFFRKVEKDPLIVGLLAGGQKPVAEYDLKASRLTFTFGRGNFVTYSRSLKYAQVTLWGRRITRRKELFPAFTDWRVADEFSQKVGIEFLNVRKAREGNSEYELRIWRRRDCGGYDTVLVDQSGEVLEFDLPADDEWNSISGFNGAKRVVGHAMEESVFEGCALEGCGHPHLVGLRKGNRELQFYAPIQCGCVSPEKLFFEVEPDARVAKASRGELSRWSPGEEWGYRQADFRAATDEVAEGPLRLTERDWFTGRKAKETFYKDVRVEEARETEWHRNGRKRTQGTKRKGKWEGLWTEWHENGRKRQQGTYKDGLKEGRWTEWWANGKKAYEGNYVADKQEGRFTEWYETGEKAKEAFYADGGEVSPPPE